MTNVKRLYAAAMKLSQLVPRLDSSGMLLQAERVSAVRVKHVCNVFLLLLVAVTATFAEEPVSSGYRLQPGDVLQVVVWKETDLQAEVLIRPDGGISFALAGDVQAAGRTTDQLRSELETRVRKLVPDAVVTVAVKAASGNRVFVIGKVNRPGDFALNRPIDVLQALSLAGGATPFANTDGIRVLRRDGPRQTSLRFRYSDVAKGRRLEQNVLLQSGDTVVVP